MSLHHARVSKRAHMSLEHACLSSGQARQLGIADGSLQHYTHSLNNADCGNKFPSAHSFLHVTACMLAARRRQPAWLMTSGGGQDGHVARPSTSPGPAWALAHFQMFLHVMTRAFRAKAWCGAGRNRAARCGRPARCRPGTKSRRGRCAGGAAHSGGAQRGGPHRRCAGPGCARDSAAAGEHSQRMRKW